MAQEACINLLAGAAWLPWPMLAIGGGAIALMIVLVFVFRHLRRRWIDDAGDTRQAGAAGFELGDIESLRSRGLISDEEFRRLRDMMLGSAGLIDKKQAGQGLSPVAQAADNKQSESGKVDPELTSHPEDVDDNEEKNQA
jgi:hypothetical protein